MKELFMALLLAVSAASPLAQRGDQRFRQGLAFGHVNPVDNDPSKRVLALINHNSDIAEYWEWSDRGRFAINVTNDAYKLGVNYIIYAMTH